ALSEIKGQLSELGRLNRGNAVLRQKVVDHLCVLNTNEEAEHAQHASWHAEVEPNAIGVPGPRPSASPDDHFVTGQILDHLLDEREYRGSPPVDEALAADLDDVRVREDLDDRLGVEQAHLGLVSRARAHQGHSHAVQGFVIHFCHLPVPTYCHICASLAVATGYPAPYPPHPFSWSRADPCARVSTVRRALLHCTTSRFRRCRRRARRVHLLLHGYFGYSSAAAA